MRSRQTAFCGLLSALAVVLMVLAGAMGIGTYAGPVLAMTVLVPVLEEYGAKAAATVYIVSALLGLLLVSETELSMVYAAFGWYPILQPRLDRIPSRPLRWGAKIALCLGTLLFLYGVVLRLLGLTADLLGSSRAFHALLLLMGTAVFLLTDRLLCRMRFLWRSKLRKKFLPS